MAEIVYLLCGGLSLLCAVLLFRAHIRRPTRLLLWSALCFLCLTINNALLFVDLFLLPNVDLMIVRLLTMFAGLAILTYGLIWDVA